MINTDILTCPVNIFDFLTFPVINSEFLTAVGITDSSHQTAGAGSFQKCLCKKMKMIKGWDVTLSTKLHGVIQVKMGL